MGSSIKKLTVFLRIRPLEVLNFSTIFHFDQPSVRYEVLKALTEEDKLHIMGDLVTKMDVDGDAEIEPSELATWIHYVEQTR